MHLPFRIPARLRNPRWLLVVTLITFSFFWLRASWLAHERILDLTGGDDEPIVTPLPDEVRHSRMDIDKATRCASFPPGIWDNVQVVIKIGSAEVLTKLAAHLDSNSACVPEPLIFSDFEEHLGSHHIFDALSNLPRDYWRDNPDYDVYKNIHKVKAMGGKLLRSMDGWKLDKYKFLPMMDLTWHMRGNRDWYVFIEADTYVFWENLFRWTRHLNPEDKFFAGSPIFRTSPPEPAFPHGGSGIVMSKAALRQLVRPPGEPILSPLPGTTQFLQDVKNKCCGDAIVADLFAERNVFLNGYWPMFNGEKPVTLRFGKPEEQWCEPVLMMHHVNETDQKELWQWEMRRPDPKPVIFEEIFHWMSPYFTKARRSNWTILAEDGQLTLPNPAAQSIDKCERACRADSACIQYQHHDDVCELSHWIRVGYERPTQEGESEWVSGRLLDRIESFRQSQKQCTKTHWISPHPAA